MCLYHNKLTASLSDDDDEEAATAAAAAGTEQKDVEMTDAEEVRMEVDPPPKKTDPYQFFWYSPEELDAMNQRQLLADVALYEGKINRILDSIS